MKIEKINENQVRITLTQEDLLHHQLRVSELAYGSEKARELFREMMNKAKQEVGFQLEEHMPIMVEAIPEKGNALVLLITKVEHPEEIDTRFTKLSPSPLAAKIESMPPIEGADDIIDVFRKLHESKTAKAAKAAGSPVKPDEPQTEVPKKNLSLVRLYHFDTIDEVIAAAHALGSYYHGRNTLYRRRKNGEYLLVIHQSGHTPEEYNRVCNILSEYAVGGPYSRASEAYLEEHEGVVVKDEAIQQFSLF